MKKDIIKLFLIFLLIIIVFYALPRQAGIIFIYTLLLYSLTERKQYFWLAFYLLVSSTPGGLFSPTDPIHSLPTVEFLRELSILEIYVAGLLIKYLLKHKPYSRYYFQTPLLILICYFTFLLLYSFVFDIQLIKILRVIRLFIPFLLIFVIPYVFANDNYLFRFIYLINYSIYILVAFQLIYYISGNEFATLIGTHEHLPSILENRVVYGSQQLIIGLIANLIMSEYDNKNSNLYYFNIFLISMSIFLSATRGYILFNAFVLFFVFLIVKFRSLPKLIIGILIIAVIFSTFFNINKQIHYSFERLSTIESVINEEYEIEESFGRITERGPRVMGKFSESPVIGYGFRDEYFEYADPHVGNQTLLLNGGIIGFLIYIGFLGYILYSLQKTKAIYHIEKKYKNIFTIIQFGYELSSFYF